MSSITHRSLNCGLDEVGGDEHGDVRRSELTDPYYWHLLGYWTHSLREYIGMGAGTLRTIAK